MSVSAFTLAGTEAGAARLLGVKDSAGPAATEAFRDLQTTPADSHLQQPHPVLPRCVLLWLLKSRPQSVWKVSRLVALRGVTGSFIAPLVGARTPLGRAGSGRDGDGWPGSDTQYWECRIGITCRGCGHSSTQDQALKYHQQLHVCMKSRSYKRVTAPMQFSTSRQQRSSALETSLFATCTLKSKISGSQRFGDTLPRLSVTSRQGRLVPLAP